MVVVGSLWSWYATLAMICYGWQPASLTFSSTGRKYCHSICATDKTIGFVPLLILVWKRRCKWKWMKVSNVQRRTKWGNIEKKTHQVTNHQLSFFVKVFFCIPNNPTCTSEKLACCHCSHNHLKWTYLHPFAGGLQIAHLTQLCEPFDHRVGELQMETSSKWHSSKFSLELCFAQYSKSCCCFF